MSIGTAIFLSSALLSAILLFGFTRDRWNWKRILVLGLLGAMLLVSGVVGLLFWNDRQSELRRKAEAERTRSLHKVRIGDPYTRVLQRQGRPDTIFSNVDGDGFVAGYRHRSGSRWVKVFAFDGDSLVMEMRFFGDSPWGMERLWTPTDGVTLGAKRGVVEQALGPPCREEVKETYTLLFFRGLDTDTTLDPHAAVRFLGDPTRLLLRYVWIEHGTGRTISHGWLVGSCPSGEQQDG